MKFRNIFNYLLNSDWRKRIVLCNKKKQIQCIFKVKEMKALNVGSFVGVMNFFFVLMA